MSDALDEIARRRWDVAVVGAGPAGSVAAAILAGRGRSVLLVERAAFPRDKVCGGCLNESAVASIERAGLGGALAELRAPALRTLRLAAGSLRADFALPGGLAVSRRVLDLAMARAAVERGVAFVDRTSARLAPADDDDWRTLLLHCGPCHGEVRASMVLACDGLRGRLLDDEPGCRWRMARRARMGVCAAAAGCAGDWPEGVIHMAVGRHGYVGVVHLADGRLNVAASLDADACRESGGPAGLVRRILRSAKMPVPEFQRFIGTGLLTRWRGALGGHRVLAVGDAAGYVEPFTGEGMAWALAGAHAAANMAEQAMGQWSPSLVGQWTAEHGRMLRRSHLTCRLIAAALRWPALVTAGIGTARALPAAAAWMVGAMNRPAAGASGTPVLEPA